MVLTEFEDVGTTSLDKPHFPTSSRGLRTIPQQPCLERHQEYQQLGCHVLVIERLALTVAAYCSECLEEQFKLARIATGRHACDVVSAHAPMRAYGTP